MVDQSYYRFYYLSQNKDNDDCSNDAKATSCSEILIVCLEGHFSMTLLLRWRTSEVSFLELQIQDITTSSNTSGFTKHYLLLYLLYLVSEGTALMERYRENLYHLEMAGGDVPQAMWDVWSQ